jgi:regulator of protease activity HflC (stomatin/prohibitin superfamily)
MAPVTLSFRKIIAWLLLACTLLFLLTGFVITEYGLVREVTLGLFDKANSTLLHTLLWGPFLILLILHVALARGIFRKS